MASAPRGPVLALLADIKEHPEEDGLRLILADWLEEHGDGPDQARAELIRCQIEYERLPVTAPEKRPAGRQARWLMQKYGPAWLGPLEQWLAGWTFCRGLLSVSVSIDSLRGQNMALLSASETWAWVDELFLLATADGDVGRLRGCALLDSVVTVGFRRSSLGVAGVEALGDLPAAQRWRGLDLSGCPLSNSGLAALVKPGIWTGLQSLDLANCLIDRSGCAHLARTKGCPLPNLSKFIFSGNHLADGGVLEFLAATWPKLCQLSLRGSHIGDIGARALADRPVLPSLRILDLSDNQIGAAGAIALAESPHLDQLESLLLWGNQIGAEAFERLRQRFGTRLHASRSSP